MLSPRSRVRRAALLASLLSLVAVSAAGAAAYRTEVGADAPFGYWQLDQTPAPPTGSPFYDANGHGALYQGSAAATAIAGAPNVSPGAAQFGGATHLAVQTISTTIPALTAEAWVRVDALPASLGTIFDSTAASGTALILYVDSTGHLRVQSQLDGLFNAAVGGAALGTGTWHHVAVTRQAGGSVQVYLDGAPTSAPIPAGAGPLTPPMTMFGVPANTWMRQADSSNALNGALDEPAIYGAVLSGARILAHYSSQANDIAPDCPDSSVVTAQDTTVTLTSTCSDADAADTLDPLVPSFTTVAGGSLSPISLTQANYTPPSGFTGSDSFVFGASDGSRSDMATLHLYVYASATAAAGGTVSSPPPSPEAPLAASVTTPGGGPVSIAPVASGSPPPGYELADGAVQITAPISTGQPLTIVLRTASTLTPLVPLRDGIAVPDCVTPVAYPCVSARGSSGGLQSVTILTDHASVWQLAHATQPTRPGKGCGDKNHVHANEADCKKLR